MTDSSISSYIFADRDISADRFDDRVKITFLRDHTIELMLPVVRCEIANTGFYPDIRVCDYGSVLQMAIDTSSDLYSTSPDHICVALSLRALSPKIAFEHISLRKEELSREIDRVVAFVENTAAAIDSNSKASVIWQTVMAEASPSCGLLDAQLDRAECDSVYEINRAIREAAKKYGGHVVDAARLAYRYGCESFIDERAWLSSKNPYSRSALVAIGQEYGKIFNVLLGRAKKCAVFDCDGTLWGGVVGEDGIDGIKLGDGHPGEAFLSLQREAKNLAARGIIIALCSKNNEEDVLEVFRDHPNMLLRLDDVAAYEINWKPKVENIAALARRLNIGIDSMVFIDDSALECGLVANALPEVDVIHLQGDPALYASTLRNCGKFNSLRLTEDDAIRNKTYREASVREEKKQRYASVDDYLASMDMKAIISINSRDAAPRAAQMTQKTNQFNLTTRRYTEKDLAAFAEDAAYDVLTISLSDNVAEMGIIGLIIMKSEGDRADIETFLLSCRALNRHVEDALFAAAMNRAIERGCDTISGVYIPTKKNGQVAELYKRLGLSLLSKSDDGATTWEGRCRPLEYPRVIDIVIDIS